MHHQAMARCNAGAYPLASMEPHTACAMPGGRGARKRPGAGRVACMCVFRCVGVRGRCCCLWRVCVSRCVGKGGAMGLWQRPQHAHLYSWIAQHINIHMQAHMQAPLFAALDKKKLVMGTVQCFTLITHACCHSASSGTPRRARAGPVTAPRLLRPPVHPPLNPPTPPGNHRAPSCTAVAVPRGCQPAAACTMQTTPPVASGWM